MPEIAVPAEVLQPSATLDATAPERVTVNDSASPSGAEAGPTDTVTLPGSVIAAVADPAVPLTSAEPVVEAPVNVTISVSPGSRTLSVMVVIVIVPEVAPDAIVRLPDGAVKSSPEVAVPVTE